ncbi:MAG: M48 family metallopeptidase [Bacteroidia bacterium]|nr:M48 family metallopeptidase [Bacteroidia bacterium]
MNPTVAALYFDGQSSASRPVVLQFDEPFLELHLLFAGENTMVWPLSELRFENYGQVLEIRSQLHSGALVKTEDPGFSQAFIKAMKQNKHVDVHSRLLGLGFSKLMVLALVLIALVGLAYFYALPPLAERAATLLPESFDEEIGNIVMESIIDEEEIDVEKTKVLQSFASRLRLNNTKALTFTVVHSEQVNAFALPNGQIVVYSGILDGMNSPEELIALLGHEATHVNKRHSIQMLCRNLSGYMVVSLLLSDVNGIMAVLADNAQQLHSLSYSRRFEKEADEEGLSILMNNHANPYGMVQLFEQLEKENKFSVPTILSTHPLTTERKENMQKIISGSSYEIKPDTNLSSIFELLKD